MNYHVLIGWAHDEKEQRHCVAIYTTAVFEIEDADALCDVGSKNRIWTCSGVEAEGQHQPII